MLATARSAVPAAHHRHRIDVHLLGGDAQSRAGSCEVTARRVLAGPAFLLCPLVAFLIVIRSSPSTTPSISSLESGSACSIRRFLPRSADIGNYVGGLQRAALRPEHPRTRSWSQPGRRRHRCSWPCRRPMRLGGFSFRAAQHAADDHARRLDVPAGRRPVRHVRTDPLPRALQHLPGADPSLHDLHPALHGLGADHLHARTAERDRGGGDRRRRHPLGRSSPRCSCR